MRTQDLRSAVYDLKFKLQGGVHDNGRMPKKPTAGNVLDELLRMLNIRPVTIMPFYTVHIHGDSYFKFPHIKSHISGRRYEIAKQSFEHCHECGATTEIVKVNLGTSAGWVKCKSDEDAKDVVANYERDRGITSV